MPRKPRLEFEGAKYHVIGEIDGVSQTFLTFTDGPLRVVENTCEKALSDLQQKSGKEAGTLRD